jgi:CelD/BcsL family acetyltransferase involved in cellulose biosynthesis
MIIVLKPDLAAQSAGPYRTKLDREGAVAVTGGSFRWIQQGLRRIVLERKRSGGEARSRTPRAAGSPVARSGFAINTIGRFELSIDVACLPKDGLLQHRTTGGLPVTAPVRTDVLVHPRVVAAPAEAEASPSAGTDGLVLRIHRDPAAVAAIWRQLDSEGDGTVFQTYGWCVAWIRHVGVLAGVKPVIVVGYKQCGAPLFLLPLAISRAHGMRYLGWLAGDLCDYNGPLLAKSFGSAVGAARFPALWRAICRSIAAEADLRFDVVMLDKMPEAVGEQANPFMALAVQPNPSGAYLTHLGAEWESFYRDTRSSSTRRRDRTKLKRLEAMGAVAFATPDEEAGIVAVLDTLFAQKRQSFAHMGVADIFARPGYQAFFRDIATDPATRGMVHVSHLDVGATLAAANFGLMWRGRYYHILASYDAGPVSRFGPGAAHLRALMQHATERGCSVFDFTIGDEPYKREWADTELGLYDYCAADTLRGQGVVLAGTTFRRLKRHIKQTPALWAAYTKLRARAGGLKRRGAEAEPAAQDDGEES